MASLRTASRWMAHLIPLVVLASSLAITHYVGTGVTPDSVAYLSAADDISSGRLPRTATGEHYCAYAPLFPTLLGAAKALGADSVQAGRLINAFALSLTVLLWCRWTVRSICSPMVQIAGILLFSFGGPLLLLSLRIWSEPVFVLLASLSVLSLLEHLRSGSRTLWLLSASALALAFLQRYSGVGFVLAFAALVLVGGRRSIPHRLAMALGYAAVGLLPCALWMWLNMHLTGAPMGERPPADLPMAVNALRGAWILGRWFIPWPMDGVEPRAIAAVLLCLVGICVWIVHLAVDARHSATMAPRLRTAISFLWVTAIFIGLMLYSVYRTNIDPLNDRYLGPAYPFLVAAIAVYLDRMMGSCASAPELLAYEGVRRSRERARRVALTVCVAFLAAMPVRFAQGIVSALQEPPESVWGGASPATVALMREELGTAISQGHVIYSNHPALLYYLTGTRSMWSPRRSPHTSSREDWGAVSQRVRSREQQPYTAQLIWFHSLEGDEHLKPVLRGLVALEQLAEESDMDLLYRGTTVSLYSVAARTGMH